MDIKHLFVFNNDSFVINDNDDFTYYSPYN